MNSPAQDIITFQLLVNKCLSIHLVLTLLHNISFYNIKDEDDKEDNDDVEDDDDDYEAHEDDDNDDDDQWWWW